MRTRNEEEREEKNSVTIWGKREGKKEDGTQRK